MVSTLQGLNERYNHFGISIHKIHIYIYIYPSSSGSDLETTLERLWAVGVTLSPLEFRNCGALSFCVAVWSGSGGSPADYGTWVSSGSTWVMTTTQLGST